VLQSERDLFGDYTPQFNKDRIKQARELSGFTQDELASLVGVKQAWIAKIENGRKAPSPELMSAIAHHVRQPLPFFTQESILELGDGTLLFRAKASISRKQEIEARRHAEIVLEMALRLSTTFNPIPVVITPLNEKPTVAAQIIRKQLGFDDVSPIPHLIRAIEKGGVMVLSVPSLEDRYAFAAWGGPAQRLPIIAISEGNSADRLRFSVAHELGHLVLHKSVSVTNKDVENQAYVFGAELVAPEKGISRELMKEKITLDRLGELKLRWGMSIQALLRRSFDLGITTERQYRYLLQQIGMRGWRTQEPVDYNIPIEKPRLLRQMAEHLYGEPLNYSSVASDAHLDLNRVRDIMERYASSTDVQATGMPSNVVRFPQTAR
jgi:Zn-dependent peptidase ImmA (M78 family)/transcriptional regulator with XRE-family HTH domain